MIIQLPKETHSCIRSLARTPIRPKQAVFNYGIYLIFVTNLSKLNEVIISFGEFRAIIKQSFQSESIKLSLSNNLDSDSDLFHNSLKFWMENLMINNENNRFHIFMILFMPKVLSKNDFEIGFLILKMRP
jgi:hypothetical protein